LEHSLRLYNLYIFNQIVQNKIQYNLFLFFQTKKYTYITPMVVIYIYIYITTIGGRTLCLIPLDHVLTRVTQSKCTHAFWKKTRQEKDRSEDNRIRREDVEALGERSDQKHRAGKTGDKVVRRGWSERPEKKNIIIRI